MGINASSKLNKINYDIGPSFSAVLQGEHPMDILLLLLYSRGCVRCDSLERFLPTILALLFKGLNSSVSRW